MSKLFLAMGAALLLNFSAWAVSMKDYEAVKMGMTYAQVVKILGSPGTELVEVKLQGRSSNTYVWENAKGGSLVIVTLSGKVVSKGQLGLK